MQNNEKRFFSKLRSPLPGDKADIDIKLKNNNISHDIGTYWYKFIPALAIFSLSVFTLMPSSNLLSKALPDNYDIKKDKIAVAQFQKLSLTQDAITPPISKEHHIAEETLFRARELADKGQHFKAFEAYIMAADIYIIDKYYDEGLSALLHANRILKEQLTPPFAQEFHKNIITFYDLNSEVAFHIGDIMSAMNYANKALEKTIEYYGTNHIETAKHYELVALFYDKNDLPEKAILCRHNALLIYQKTKSLDDGQLLIKMNNIGEAYRMSGKNEDAERMISETIQFIEQKYGTSAPELAIPLNNLALVMASTHQHTKAEAYLMRAYEISYFTQGAEHDVTHYIDHNLKRLQNGFKL